MTKVTIEINVSNHLSIIENDFHFLNTLIVKAEFA